MIGSISLALQIAAWFLPSLIVYLVAGLCKNFTSKKILRILAVGTAVYLAVLFIFLGAAAVTCSGNALYGYGECTLFPDRLANLSAIVLILSVLSLLAIALISMGVAGVAEWKFRQKCNE